MSNSYLILDDVVLLGRTLEEYRQFFLFEVADLKGKRVLDVGSGVSSFCAEGADLGIEVIGLDPIYGLSGDEIEQKCKADLSDVASQLPSIAGNYKWDFYRDIGHLCEFRSNAYGKFLADYELHRERYVSARLPEIQFNNDTFELTLSSHFLFLYDEQFDYDFHRKSLLELTRVTSGETLIYPIANLRTERSAYIDRLLNDRDCEHLDFEIRRIRFEFLKNADELLIIRKRD